MAQPEATVDKYVYVVTCSELGWDCVVGVFDPASVTLAEMQQCFPEKHHYYIDHRSVQHDLGEYRD